MKVEDIEKDIGKKLKSGVKETKEHVLDLIDYSISDFYNDYDQKIYDRQNQLANSVEDGGVQSTKNHAGFKIWFNPANMSHPNPAYGKDHKWHIAEWSEDEILSVALFDDGSPHGHSMYTLSRGKQENIYKKIYNGVGDVEGLKDIKIVLYSKLLEAGLPIH